MMKLPNRPFRFLAIQTLVISLLFAASGLVTHNQGAMVPAFAFVHLSLLFSWLEWREKASMTTDAAAILAIIDIHRASSNRGRGRHDGEPPVWKPV